MIVHWYTDSRTLRKRLPENGKKRNKCTFDVKELIHLIDGGEEITKERKNVENIVLSVKELEDPIPEEYLSHKERYENAVRKGSILYKILLEHEKKKPVSLVDGPTNIYKVQHGVINDISPLMLHFGMFIPTIRSQASPEQQEKWLKHRPMMIGTYAQTELGHGTFLRGLETTSTYDPQTEEFILNSPTLTSYKWWPGGLAHTANHCIVMAQLYIKDKCYGIHPFLVQIRDFDTHVPLPGIKVGEIGPKQGFQTANNGFLGFDKVGIPRENMLMKNSQVLKDGTYVKAKNDKLTYGTMVLVRVYILSDVSYELARAATIAVRYAAVRHQSQPKPGQPEPQIIDYVTQQHKLFIAISTSHACRVVGRWLWNTYMNVLADIMQGNMENLPELHALSCCLKAVCSYDAARCVEHCRQACGGHGYMTSSYLPILYGIVTATITYEGEYTVLLLQTARYLMKSHKNALEGKPLMPTVAYLGEFLNRNVSWNNSPDGIVDGFKAVAAGLVVEKKIAVLQSQNFTFVKPPLVSSVLWRVSVLVAQRKTKAAYDTLEGHVAAGQDFEDAWNLASVQLTYASEAHARVVLCEMFWKETQRISSTVSSSLAPVLSQLAELYIVFWALEKRGDMLMYTNISREDIVNMQKRYEELLALIRPNAIGLVDGFDIRDEILRSTLGAYDGRVYERLMEEALKSPLNAEPVNQSFHKYLKPLIHSKL